MTTTMRDAIREHTRLSRMRQGQEVGEPIDIPSLTDESGQRMRVMQVPLTDAESQAGVVRAAAADVIDNAAGLQHRNRLAMQSDVWHSLREPGDLDTKVFQSVEEMVDTIDPTDLDYLFDGLALLMDHASPAIDGLTDADMDELKKAFGAMDWSELTGRRWAAVRLCLLVLLPELLQARLRGSTSIDSLTEMSESAASTSSANLS